MFKIAILHKHKVVNNIKLLLLLLSSIFMLRAAYASVADILYSTAQVPQVQSCLVGKKALNDDEASYSKLDINGSLPYIRYYETTLSDTLSRQEDMIDPVKTTTGWTDNYNNFLYVTDVGKATSKTGQRMVINLRLPEDTVDRYYLGSVGSNYTFKEMSRIFYLDDSITYANNLVQVNSSETNQRDFELTLTNAMSFSGANADVANLRNLSFKLNNNGNIYTFKYIKDVTSSKAIYKISSISYVGGKTLA